jgi:hypothetical protein
MLTKIAENDEINSPLEAQAHDRGGLPTMVISVSAGRLGAGLVEGAFTTKAHKAVSSATKKATGCPHV